MFHCCNECFTEMDVNRQVDEEEKKDRASALNEALMALMRASTISLPSLTFNEPINEAMAQQIKHAAMYTCSIEITPVAPYPSLELIITAKTFATLIALHASSSPIQQGIFARHHSRSAPFSPRLFLRYLSSNDFPPKTFLRSLSSMQSLDAIGCLINLIRSPIVCSNHAIWPQSI